MLGLAPLVVRDVFKLVRHLEDAIAEIVEIRFVLHESTLDQSLYHCSCQLIDCAVMRLQSRLNRICDLVCGVR